MRATTGQCSTGSAGWLVLGFLIKGLGDFPNLTRAHVRPDVPTSLLAAVDTTRYFRDSHTNSLRLKEAVEAKALH
jgi:hypothetical protein